MKENINHEGYTFESHKPQKWYGRKRNRRLRKKLKVNEFLELGITQSITIPITLTNKLADDLLDSFIDLSYVDSGMFLGIGFTIQRKGNLSFELTWEIDSHDVTINHVNDKIEFILKNHGLDDFSMVTSYVDLN